MNGAKARSATPSPAWDFQAFAQLARAEPRALGEQLELAKQGLGSDPSRDGVTAAASAAAFRATVISSSGRDSASSVVDAATTVPRRARRL